jgi:tRNA-specific 2-thiouridylase
MYRLRRGADTAKDQSYVVHMLGQEALARTMFPVGEIEKSEVRRLAADMGLRTASKPDSQDVCFITSTGGRETFLGDRISFKPGRVVDVAGNQLGVVESIEMVTIGQRRGIGLPGGGPKRYVLDVDVPRGVVVVGDDTDTHVSTLLVEALTWGSDPVDGDVLVQCSAHGEPERGNLTLDANRAIIEWAEPQRRIAPGQSVVFYEVSNRYVVGGGTAVTRRAADDSTPR